jgi:hypothetical protein
VAPLQLADSLSSLSAARKYATAANGAVGQVKTVIGAVVDVSPQLGTCRAG